MECMNTQPLTLRPACSFKSSLHPHFHTIEAECQSWILSFTNPASRTASHFWLTSAFPFLCCLAYAHCATPRVVLLVKLFVWFFVCDSDDDDPSMRGCESELVLSRRHELLLELYAGKFNPDAVAADLCKGALTCSNAAATSGTTTSGEINILCDVLPGKPTTSIDENSHKIIKGLDVLHDIWTDVSKDMSPKMLCRYLQYMRDHLNGNKLQAHYRRAGRLPGIEEYVYGLRRPTSLLMVCFILMEYGLGIELDDETLGSETVMRLQHAVTDHVAMVNDVFSCEVEKSIGDYFNLPCVILRERACVQPGFTFADAMREALSMIEEVDKECVQLIKEVESSKLMEKAGVEAYLRGLEMWMAGNLEWSLKTARYSHTCSAADQGVVRSVCRQLP